VKKELSKSARARELIKQGDLTAKQIARRVGLNVSTIYTIKWKLDNKQGLGAIKPQTPPVGQGTGIAASVPRAPIPLEFEIIDRPKKKSNNRRNAQLKRWARERHLKEIAQLDNIYGRTVLVTSPPTLWQRIKAFVFGA
jgi:transcriptional regulator with XRE-family HTH domain